MLHFDRLSIVEEARTWCGVPFRHQGRNRQGIDCAGLVIAIAWGLRLSGYDYKADYRREPKPDEFIAAFRANMREKPIADRLSGDIVLIRDGRFTCHSAVIDGDNMIHAFATRRKVVKERFTDDWLNRCTYCFAYPGVSD